MVDSSIRIIPSLEPKMLLLLMIFPAFRSQVVAALDASRAELRTRSEEADGLREEYRDMAQRLQALQGAADRERETGEKHRIASLVLQSEVSFRNQGFRYMFRGFAAVAWGLFRVVVPLGRAPSKVVHFPF